MTGRNRKSSYSSILPPGLAISGLLLLLIMTGCSHTTPYCRPGISPLADTRQGQTDIRQRILLVGDVGDTNVSGSTLPTLRRWAEEIPQRTMLIFLGDNIYPAGLPEKDHPERKDAEQRIGVQLDIIKESGVRGFFISGNHDWADDGKGGLQAVKRQEQYVNQALGSEGNFFPPGCAPGPAKIDLDGVRIIVLNTAWWLHKEGATASPDPQKEKDSVIEELKNLLDGAGQRDVIVVGHHPLASHGTQGGFYDWKDHLFPSTHLVPGLWIPTPVLGSLYPLLRGRVFNRQTLAGTEYTEMRERLTATLSTDRPLICAAGHDHGLQVLEGGKAAEYILVSAMGLDVGAALGHGDDTLFAHLHPGFMAVDFMKDGRVLLRVIEPGDNAVVFSRWIKGGVPSENPSPDPK